LDVLKSLYQGAEPHEELSATFVLVQDICFDHGKYEQFIWYESAFMRELGDIAVHWHFEI
jgi:hypothetical protein